MAKGFKTGGRTKGTPNRNNPVKQYLRTHSSQYFRPCIPLDDALAESLGTDLEKLCWSLGLDEGDTGATAHPSSWRPTQPSTAAET